MRRRLGLLAIAIPLVAIALTGCARQDTPVPATQSQPPSNETTIADLNGLVVTLATTSGPGPDLFEGPNFSNDATPPVQDRVRLTVIARAVNSGVTTLPVQIKHHYPVIRDADGNYLASVDAALTGGPGDGGGDVLAPGGVLRTVQYLDISPDQTGLTFAWEFGDLGTATSEIPPKR